MMTAGSYTAFIGPRRLAAGALVEVALVVKAAMERDPLADALAFRDPHAPLLVFDDTTGQVVDLDLRGSAAEVRARLAPPAPAAADETGAGRGRPKLGVVAREVTLLPRHWEWLATRPGGASNALRRLVEEAMRADGGKERARVARVAAYRFMSAMAGDLPGFEEASRALFADDPDGFGRHCAPWPPDIASHVRQMAWGLPEHKG